MIFNKKYTYEQHDNEKGSFYNDSINPLNSKAHYNLSNLISYNSNGKQHSSQLLLNLKLSKSPFDLTSRDASHSIIYFKGFAPNKDPYFSKFIDEFI